jgi:plasmid stability protein
MANLPMRNVPVDLYHLFKDRAEAHNRTLGEEAIAAWQAVVLPEGRSGNTQAHATKRRVIARRTDATDQEGVSQQHDLLGAESSLPEGRRNLDRRGDRKPRLSARGRPELWNQFFSR